MAKEYIEKEETIQRYQNVVDIVGIAKSADGETKFGLVKDLDVIEFLQALPAADVRENVPDADVGEFAKDTNVPSNAEFKTVYGYPVENLVLFADACKKAGIDNEDLKRFCDNAESAWMYAWDEFKRKQDKALRDIMSGMTGGAEDG